MKHYEKGDFVIYKSKVTVCYAIIEDLKVDNKVCHSLDLKLLPSGNLITVDPSSVKSIVTIEDFLFRMGFQLQNKYYVLGETIISKAGMISEVPSERNFAELSFDDLGHRLVPSFDSSINDSKYLTDGKFDKEKFDADFISVEYFSDLIKEIRKTGHKITNDEIIDRVLGDNYLRQS